MRNLQLLAALERRFDVTWKEECMNHGRGERTDHLPIFDPTKLCQKNGIEIDRHKSHLHQSTLIDETAT